MRSESGSQQLVGIGLNNLLAIAMPDAVLVAPKERAQDVKNAVELLKTKQIAQAEIFPKITGHGVGLKAWRSFSGKASASSLRCAWLTKS